VTPGWVNVCGVIDATAPRRRIVPPLVSVSLWAALLGFALYALLP